MQHYIKHVPKQGPPIRRRGKQQKRRQTLDAHANSGQRPKYRRSRLKQIEPRIAKLRRKFWWRAAIITSVIVALSLSTWGLWQSSKVSQVFFQGTERISLSEIEDVVGDLEGDNIFLLSTGSIEEALLRDIALASAVEIERTYFPNTVRITVFEGEPQAVWHVNNLPYLVDERGLVLGRADQTRSDLPQVYTFGAQPVAENQQDDVEEPVGEGELDVEPEALSEEISLSPFQSNTANSFVLEFGDRVSDGEFIHYLSELHNLLPDQTPAPILYYQEGEFDDVGVYLANGWVLWFNSDYVLSSDLRRLSTTLQQVNQEGGGIGEYVDLRFEKVYFK